MSYEILNTPDTPVTFVCWPMSQDSGSNMQQVTMAKIGSENRIDEQQGKNVGEMLSIKT